MAWSRHAALLALLVCTGCARGTVREDPGDYGQSDDPSSAGDAAADASDEDPGFDESGDGDSGDGDSGDGDPGDGDEPGDGDPGDGDAPGDGDGPADSGTAEPTDAGAVAPLDAGGDGDSSEPDAGAPPDPTCVGTSSCAQPVDLGELSGDTTKDPITLMGTTSAVYAVHITEDDHTFLVPRDLQVHAALAAPGANFDLYLYAAGNNCSLVSDSSEGPGSERVDAIWGDDQGIGGVESARTVFVEVRHKSGVCEGAAAWTLTITGN